MPGVEDKNSDSDQLNRSFVHFSIEPSGSQHEVVTFHYFIPVLSQLRYFDNVA